MSLTVVDQASHTLLPTETSGHALVSSGTGQVTLSQSLTLPRSGVSRITAEFVVTSFQRPIAVIAAQFPVE